MKITQSTILLFLLIFTLTNTIHGQNIEGYVHEKNSGTPLENITIKVVSVSDTSKHKETTSDASGFFQLNDIVTGMSKLPVSADDKMRIAFNGSQLQIQISSKHSITNGKLFTVDGRMIAATAFEKAGNNQFTATFDITDAANQILFFTDNIHSAKIIIPVDNWETETIELTKGNIPFKSGNNGEAQLLFQLDDDEEFDKYQSLTELKNVDLLNPNYFSFELEKWPQFFASLYFNLRDKYGNQQGNTTINIVSLNGQYTFSLTTNANGGAQIENISIPSLKNNKLIPDSLDFVVEIEENNYLHQFTDTLQKVSAGDLIKNYHNLTPKQQEFFANVYNLVKSEKTGNPLSGVLAKLWTQGKQDTIRITTGADGKANFENLEIPAVNEITPGTLNKVLELSGTDLETKLDNIAISDGNYNKTYYMTEKQVIPEDKQYTIIINSKDEKGNNLPNVNWTISNIDNTTVGSGNTGSNSLDTLQFLNPNNSLNLKINSNKEEYTNYNTTKNFSAGQTTITTVNELMKYLYELQVSGKDSETKALLDSVEVKAFLNGQLLMSGNSLENTIANLQTTQAGHSLDLKVLIDRNGYVRSDSIPITINEGQENSLVYELVKEQEENGVAYLWRAFRDPLQQNGTKADIIIENLENNHKDTIFALPSGTIWKDTVLVNPTGTTTYSMRIIPTVQEGSIPLYELEKTFELSPNQTAQGIDDLKSLEQQVVIKGDIDGSDGGEAGITNVIFTASDGKQHTTTTNSSGEYRLGPFPVGTTGEIDFIIPANNPKSSTYFNHKDIPVGEANTQLGRVPLSKDAITAFEDSVLTYNPLMIQKQWTYPVTGEKVTINPSYLKSIEGASYNASWALWGEQRVYNTPNSDNPDWPTQMGAFIREHTGIPFNVILVDTEIGTAPQITSLDPTYLQSIRNKMGNNIKSSVTEAGYTTISGGGSIDNLIFHTTANITLDAPVQGEEPTDYMYASGMRELIGRNGELSETNQYKSFMNGAFPTDIKVTDMTTDFANVAIIYTNMSSRAKKKTHTVLFTLE